MQCSLSRLLLLFLSYVLISVNLLTCSVSSDFLSIEIVLINSFQFEFECWRQFGENFQSGAEWKSVISWKRKKIYGGEIIMYKHLSGGSYCLQSSELADRPMRISEPIAWRCWYQVLAVRGHRPQTLRSCQEQDGGERWFNVSPTVRAGRATKGLKGHGELDTFSICG